MTTDQLVEGSVRDRDPINFGGVLVGGGLLFFCVAWAFSAQGRMEDDEAKHFLQALFAWSDWRILLDAWGRPGFTLPASIVALFGGGYTSIRLFGMLCTWGAAMGAWRGSWLLGLPYAWLSPLILLSMPSVLKVGAGAYTEPVFALALIWGLALLLDRRYWAAALCLGWLPITRLEGALLLPPLALFFLARKAWWQWLPMGIPMLAWMGSTWMFSGDPLWVVHSVPYRVNQYGDQLHGDWGHYARLMTELMGPPLLAALLIGVFVLLRRRDGLPLIAAAGVYYLVQELAFYFAYGSAGYLRFLVGGAPVFAVMAHAGLLFATGHFSAERQTIRLAQFFFLCLILISAAWFPGRPISIAILCAVAWLAVLVADAIRDEKSSPQWLVAWLPRLLPPTKRVSVFLLLSFVLLPAKLARPQNRTSLNESTIAAAEFARPLLESNPSPYIASTIFEFPERLGYNAFDRERAAGSFTEGDVLHTPPGALLFWDSHFGPNLWHIGSDWWSGKTIEFELLHTIPAHKGGPEVRLYRRR
ncbi:hypothetical protein GC173_04285 [bacterium]|nr:hypothetical protein [bacterium]